MTLNGRKTNFQVAGVNVSLRNQSQKARELLGNEREKGGGTPKEENVRDQGNRITTQINSVLRIHVQKFESFQTASVDKSEWWYIFFKGGYESCDEESVGSDSDPTYEPSEGEKDEPLRPKFGALKWQNTKAADESFEAEMNECKYFKSSPYIPVKGNYLKRTGCKTIIPVL